jgi:endogenous inhibitor of DNA gyrase (YacG/DUF329 family)
MVSCPVCRKKGAWFATPYGPFCSKRCRLVDLGRWLGEEHKISSPLLPENLDEEAPPVREDKPEA